MYVSTYRTYFDIVSALRAFWTAHANDLSKLPIKNLGLLSKYESYLEAFRVTWTRSRSLKGWYTL